MERPILFSTEMVKAILVGHKTQTRRVIRNPEKYSRIRECGFCCPYGKVGDTLWVRETFRYNKEMEGGGIPRLGIKYGKSIEWKANHPLSEKHKDWKPSIHMPRWASRITLEITKVQVQRLQEISKEDALVEGIRYDKGLEGYCVGEGMDMRCFHGGDPRRSFYLLWEDINAKRGYSWESNPWVYVLEFKVIPKQ